MAAFIAYLVTFVEKRPINFSSIFTKLLTTKSAMGGKAKSVMANGKTFALSVRRRGKLKEQFRLAMENNQLKKRLEKEISEKERVVREYLELAEFAMERDLKKSSWEGERG